MKKRKIILLGSLGIIILGLVCLFYGFKIEPYRLKVDDYQLTHVNIENLKLVHISDLHIKHSFREDRLEKIVAKINQQEADFVFFTGDLFDDYRSYGDQDQVAKELGEIQAKYGKFAIWGNHDYRGDYKQAYENTMEAAGFRLLRNERAYVEVAGQVISIYGLDDDSLGEPDYSKATRPRDYEILLAHEQKYLAENHFKADLILSGHTHGGQIDLPFINELGLLKSINPSLVSPYIKGFYNTENGRLFINSGLGTTILRARFNVPPEISVINISRP